jgi:hypothetical protein
MCHSLISICQSIKLATPALAGTNFGIQLILPNDLDTAEFFR